MTLVCDRCDDSSQVSLLSTLRTQQQSKPGNVNELAVSAVVTTQCWTICMSQKYTLGVSEDPTLNPASTPPPADVRSALHS